MTLPFNQEQEDRNKRKYVCFICGRAYTEFSEFSQHIIESHEEGREYIICPLERCKAPIRDLKLHFKCKHPTEKVPEKGMLKAIVWKDFNTKSGKSKTRKPNFRQGWYESTKMRKNFHYRSGYEATVYECLDQLDEVFGFDVEPFEVPYIHQGEPRTYIPDLFVSFVDGKKEIWEIKPSNQTSLQINQDKWHACAAACQARGWELVVITEMGIEKLKKKVKGQV